MTFKVAGVQTHREADIKVQLPKNHKVVILCDGEVFHGPGSLYTEPSIRIEDDVATAEGFFSLGYSVIRYSESEILAGDAVAHFDAALPALQAGGRLYRTWYPAEERWA